MKKNYFLTLFLSLCLVGFSYGQEMLVNGGFENWDNDTTPTSWTKVENITKEASEKHSGSFSAKHVGGTKDIGQTITGIVPGDSYTITIWYKVIGGDGTDARIWSYWKTSSDSNISDNAAELRGPSNAYFDNNGGAWSKYETTITAPATASKLYFELRTYGSATVYWDDLSVFHNTPSSDPTLVVTAPADNTVFNPSTTETSLKFTVSNFTLSKDNGSGASDGSGQGYIKATLKKDGNLISEPKFFTETPSPISVTAGSTYIATAELVDNSGNSLNPKVEKSITFSVATYTEVADLAALRAGTEGMYYKVTGGVAITYNAGNSRNQRYIQDATAGILIDDSAGTITTNYNVGDGLVNIVGKLSSFAGVLQLVPTADYGAAATTGNAVAAQTVTIVNLNANLDMYESEWIKINGVTFADADGTKVFEAGKNYNISDGTNTLVFRTNFSGADFIGQIIPTGTVNITGLAAEFNGTAQIFATATANIVLGVEKNNIQGFTAYPNPVRNGRLTVSTNSATKKEVTIFNVLGKRVFTQTFTGNNKQLDVSRINPGIYIMKVVEDEKIATKKLVIK
ncbi:MAG: T9SS type A sorting domain-containing protein [Flavobacteriaceae bacterium]|nr:T9SS type A sorting domain-containing protein [Flavobacteriaceae bacterium]